VNEFFGIDFGTTNSAVVGHLRRNVTNYGDGDDQPFPLVAVSKATGSVYAIGREAWNRREELMESCRLLSSAKTGLGSNRSERIGPELWTPERVVTEILKAICKQVTARGNGAALDSAVIAIPVGFSPEKRRALREAARTAGITVRGFVSESTAAVFKSFPKVCQWPTVVVFDWGGGTLDISVIAIKGDTVEEIATASNPLAGDQLDRRLAEWAHMQILRQSGKDGPPLSGIEARYRDLLISQCETAKRTLASEDLAEISIVRYGEFGTVNLELSAEEFARLLRPAIEEAIATLENCVVNKARLSFDQVGSMILVGGSSKLRGLRDAMDAKGWTCAIDFPQDSEWHVADGAAILAAEEGNYVCAQNVGVKLCDNTIYALLQSGHEISRDAHVMTFGLVDDADNARFVFVESRSGTDSYLSATDPVLGYLSVPTYGFSDESVRIESHIDENLLLHVKAQSACRGRKNSREWTYPQLRFSYRLPS